MSTNAHIVAYDLRKQGQDYSGLIARLQSYPQHWHMQGSVWLIVTAQTDVQVRDYLLPAIDTNDQLIVARLDGEAAWSGYTSNIGQWLQTTLKRAA